MRLKLWILRCALPAAALLYGYAESDAERRVRFARMSREAEAKGLADPFKGVTANGSVEPGLFPIRATKVSTKPMREAALAFLGALTAEQKAHTQFPIDDPEWRKWMNQHFYQRQGIGFIDMNDAQKQKAFALMKASLSPKGFDVARKSMQLNHTLGELNNNDMEQYGEWRYYLTIMGEPSDKKPWGWQIDGHHLIINYFVLGDQVVMSPTFLGSEPVVARSGKYAGIAILQDEQRMGLQMVRALSEEQRAKAVLQVSKTGNNNLTEAFKDNVVLDYAGVQASSFTPAQKKQISALIHEYVRHMDDGHAKVKMQEVEKHLDRTFFAWIGGTADDSVYYYRIHSPVILIEFDHQRPVGMRHLMKDPTVPFKDHIHSVIRTPNGNDYGKDLLRQHYAASRH
jgi:hypothetical protein